jgi:hypothetical protein
VHDVCASIRQQTVKQEDEEIAKAKGAGIEFFKLSDEDMAWIKSNGDVAHKKYADEINKLYPGDTYRPQNYLKEVQDFMGYAQ